ncbi:MAG TPA: 2-C-methyl-D-erythritol 4-phosphate cytidylyltransferase [Ignavibacteriales bacterium]|nr:2-C-methyl-D-erythritol 4-phosphate cytidylyltransferase [Ignavibacteriales bacterium]
MKTVAVIPCGGKGLRTGSSIPKQYVKFGGKELLVYTLEIFQKSQFIDEIAIAVQKDYIGFIQELSVTYKISKLKYVVEGGAERQDSVYNALLQLKADDNDLIAVHDAARPMLDKLTLERAIKGAETFDNIVMAVKARDTLIRGNDFALEYVDRNTFYYAQTPQIFRYYALKHAMENAYKDGFYGTDESMLVHRAGYNVKIIEGSFLNIKITAEEDMELFKLYADRLNKID